MTYEQVKERYEDDFGSNTIDKRTEITKGKLKDTFVITFHGNPIIKFFPNGDQKFYIGERKSYTLWDRIIKFSDGVIPSVQNGNFEEMILTKNGQSYEFWEGVLIEA